MTNNKIQKIKSYLQNIKDLDSKKSITETETLNNVLIENNVIIVILYATKPKKLYNEIISKCENLLQKNFQDFKINIVLTSENNNPQESNTNISSNLKPKNIKHIIAVASGKGGVGKSTITTNVAVTLAQLKYKVAILDADIYGPSQPKMLGLKNAKPNQNTEGKIETLKNYGVKCMSIGFLIEETKPMIWRGPMVQSALEQLVRDVDWGELDFLLVDMPPGTGDVQLTMTQKVGLSGAIIVSTPQDIALIDAVKGLNMFKKVNVPKIGIIENMSHFICPKCNEKNMIFGSNGVHNTAKEMNISFLGQIPLNIDIRINSDLGKPHKNNLNEYFVNICEEIINFSKK